MSNQFVMIIWAILISVFVCWSMSSRHFIFIDHIDKREKNNLDSLRGLLSLMVVFHHLIYNYYFNISGDWAFSGYEVFKSMGALAVGLFFILSGFLFSRVSINKLGLWAVFYKKRIFRIMPVVLISSSICVALAFCMSTSKQFYYIDILSWFDGGLVNYRPDLFGVSKTGIINSGVSWTLFWEWRLYFSLPVIGILIPLKMRLKASVFISIISYLMYVYLKAKWNGSEGMISPTLFSSVFFFSFGFFVSYLDKELVGDILRKNIFGVIIFICFFFIPFTGKLSGAILPLYSAFIFLCVCCGNDLLGVLKNNGLKRMGVVSYTIYLMHGIFWYAGFRFGLTSGGEISLSLIFIVMLLSSIFISKCIEYPVYNLTKKK